MDSEGKGKNTRNFETSQPVGNYGLKCLTHSVMLSPGQCKIIDHKSFHINHRISLANVIY